jgi:hypothetical protein
MAGAASAWYDAPLTQSGQRAEKHLAPESFWKEIDPMRSRYLLAGLLGAGLALALALPSPADEAPSKETIDKLIEQMGSDTFAEREKAMKELAAIGVPALEALQKAAKSDDAEIRKRAESLIPKIEIQAESIRVLKPKRVHLVYKDTPLPEAVADFRKKSGYQIHLHDPDEKLKERKITLDTGDTTFWHALALFRDKAELTEASMEDLMRAPQLPPNPGGRPVPLPPQRIKPLPPVKKQAPPTPPAKERKAAPAEAPAPQPAPPPAKAALRQAVAQPAIARPVRRLPFMPGMPGQIVLKDGKAKKYPTDDRSAIRVRALGKSDQFGNPGEGEVILALEVSPEPKLQWQGMQSIRIDKAVDDRDQKLTQVIPQVEGPAGAVGVGIAVPGAPNAVRPQIIMRGGGWGGGWGGWGGVHQQVPVQLKKGAKAAKALKELKGVITAHLLTEERPYITANKLKAGETFKGKEGGSIKIVQVKEEENKTTLRVELEQPPADKVVPAQQGGVVGMPGVAPPIRRLPRQGVKILPAPAQPAPAAPPEVLAAQAPAPAAPPQAAPPPVQIQIGVGGGVAIGGGMPMMAGTLNGLSIQDAKGKALQWQVQQTQVRGLQQGGVFTQVWVYTLVIPHDKDKDKPAKVVYLGRKRTTIDIPFALKDVPLP